MTFDTGSKHESYGVHLTTRLLRAPIDTHCSPQIQSCHLSMAKFRSCLMIEYVYTCLNMICLSVIMAANHVVVTCLTIKHDQDANEFYQCKNIICSLDYHC